jgi:amidase
VIIAKTMMTELANWVANGMPGNYNGLKGYGFNPYDPRRDPRGPQPAAQGARRGGPGAAAGRTGRRPDPLRRWPAGARHRRLELGLGTAASFWAGNVGTETSGSILSPSNQNMLAGIKPTVGRISRYGVIPITADQDTAGPMARTVADAATMLGALESPSPDSNDPATTTCQAPPNRDYTVHLKADALKGARIGIPKAFFYDPLTLPGEKEPRGGLNPAQRKAMDDAIRGVEAGRGRDRRSRHPEHRGQGSEEQLPAMGYLRRSERRPRQGRELLIGPQVRNEARLQRLPEIARRSRAGEVAHRVARVEQGTRQHGRESSTARHSSTCRTTSTWSAIGRSGRADRKKDIYLGGTHGIDEMLKSNKLDALLFPGARRCGDLGQAGLPHGDRPVRDHPERAAERDLAGGLRTQAGAYTA